MPASVSSSSMSSSSNGGGGGCRDCHGVSVTVCHLCDTMTPQNGPCPMKSCTPIDALPGHYQDQQRYPLPPIPRERGRSRATTRGRAPMPPSGVPPPHPVPPPNNQVQVFCSPVILSTSGVEKGQGGGTPTSSSSKWGRPSGGSRQSRQRSASAKRQPDSRQRQGASLIRQPSLLIQTTAAAASSESSEATAYSDNCPLCQPRYSKSPERLRMRPSQPQHTVIYFYKFHSENNQFQASKNKQFVPVFQ